MSSEKKGPQKRLRLQMWCVQDFTKCCRALPESNIEERGILRGVTIPRVSLAVGHTKGAPDDEGVFCYEGRHSQEGQ